MRHWTVIQALRAIAASAVILMHLVSFETKYLPGPPLLPSAAQLSGLGVDLFFVISGFIITTVSLRQFGRPGAWRRFLVHRMLRIYPPYWFYTLLVLAVLTLRPDLVSGKHGQANLLASFLLLPDDQYPVLGVAWSLIYEVYFYAVFAVLLAIVARRHVAPVLGLWATSIVAGRLVFGPLADNLYLSSLVDPLILEFLAGCAVAMTVDRFGRRMSLALTVVALGGMVIAISVWARDAAFPGEWPRVLVFGSLAAMLVAGLVGLERTACLTSPRLLMRLGDASYSIYLSHTLTITAFGLVCRAVLVQPGPLSHAATIIAAFILALLGGWVGYCLLEAPLLSWTLGLRRRQQATAATAP